LALMRELDRIGKELEADDAVRVVVFDSADPDFFIAHADVSLIEQIPTNAPRPTTLGFFHVMVERFRTMPNATIRKVEGRASDGGGARAHGALPGGRRRDAGGRDGSPSARVPPRAVARMSVRPFALTCGWLTGPAGGFLAGARGRLRVAVPAFLFDHPGGKALFDSGLHPDAGRDPDARLGPAARVFEVELRDGEDVAARLATL